MDVFAAIADPVRRDLLRSLSAGSARVVDLAADHPISRPAVSKHLRVLADAGLVVAQDVGRERHYRLRPEALRPVESFVGEVAAAGARPPVTPMMLDALDLEVRRVVRDRGPAERDDRTASRARSGQPGTAGSFVRAWATASCSSVSSHVWSTRSPRR